MENTPKRRRTYRRETLNRIMINVRIPKPVHKRLIECAADLDWPITDVVTAALEAYLPADVEEGGKGDA